MVDQSVAIAVVAGLVLVVVFTMMQKKPVRTSLFDALRNKPATELLLF